VVGPTDEASWHSLMVCALAFQSTRDKSGNGNPRPEKVAVVDDVRARLDQADAVIVTSTGALRSKTWLRSGGASPL